MRNDVHRPSEIDPADYEYVAQEYLKIEGMGDCYILQQNREMIRAHMARSGGNYSGHAHGGNCMVCGSVNAMYTVLFYHAKTNSYVRMGQDCAEKCDMGDAESFRAFREGIKSALACKTGKAKAQALLAERGLERAWAIYGADEKPGREEVTVTDMVGKLVQYGSLSDKQYDFLKTLLDRIITRPQREAQRAAEDAAAKPCPSGRIEITGTVLTTKEQPSDYAPGGSVLKMLVRADDGWKVWGTVPSCIIAWKENGEERVVRSGVRVRFTATVTVSDKDNKFGFYKRPTNAAVLSYPGSDA